AAGRFREDRWGPGRGPALQALAPPPLDTGVPAVAAPGPLPVFAGRERLALAVQFVEALADRVEIVGGAGAVHRGLRLSDPNGMQARFFVRRNTPATAILTAKMKGSGVAVQARAEQRWAPVYVTRQV